MSIFDKYKEDERVSIFNTPRYAGRSSLVAPSGGDLWEKYLPPSPVPATPTAAPADTARSFREREAGSPADILKGFRFAESTAPAIEPVDAWETAHPAQYKAVEQLKTMASPADVAKGFRERIDAAAPSVGGVDTITGEKVSAYSLGEMGKEFAQGLGRGFEELGRGIVKGLTFYSPPKEGVERGLAGRILDWAYTPREDATFVDKANSITGEILGNLPFYLMGEALISKAVKTFGPAATLGLSARAIQREMVQQAIPSASTAMGRILQSGARSAGQLAPRLGAISMARQSAQEAVNPQEGASQRIGIAAGEGLAAGALFGFVFGTIAQAYPEAKFKIQVMRAGRKVALPKDAPRAYGYNEVQAEINRLVNEGWKYDPKRGTFIDPENPTYAATIYVEHQGKRIRLTEILKTYGGNVPSEATLASSIRKTPTGIMRPAPIAGQPPAPAKVSSVPATGVPPSAEVPPAAPVVPSVHPSAGVPGVSTAGGVAASVPGEISTGSTVYHSKTNEPLTIVDDNDTAMLTVENKKGTQFKIGRDAIRMEPSKGTEDETKISNEAEKPTKPLASLATGKTAAAKTMRGTTIETEYALVDAGSLTASHDTALRENPAFPQELQPRDRTRAASDVQINNIITKLEPTFLGESPKASEGAPIVGKDGIVESGNARVIALKKMYEINHKNAEVYKNWLKDNAEKFGLAPESVEGTANPVLVRIRQSDVDRAKFVQEANEQAVATMSASEQARADAKKLTGAVMEMFVPTETGEILTLANSNFIATFAGEIIGEAEKGEFMTKEGHINQAGVLRIRNAIFTKAYGDIEAVEMLAESTDVNVKNQINAMLMAAPRMIKLKEGIEKGELYNLDVSSEIANAMKQLSTLRATGTTVERFMTQISLVDSLSPLEKDILATFDKNKRSAKRIASILNKYMDAVEMIGNPAQATLVERDVPTKEEVLEWAIRKVSDVDQGQIDILSGQGVDDTEAGPHGKGIPEKTREKTGAQAFAGQAQRLRYQQKNPNIVEPVKRKDIINFLSEKLDVPVRVGRFRQRALGIFKIKPEVIRTKLANDIPTIAHEVGHYLDKKLKLADKTHDAELQALGQRTSRPSYSKEQVRAEGVAEFMRLYLTEPDEALRQARGYYAAFENKMLANGEIHDILLQARQDIKAWTEQPAKARVLGSLSIGEKKPRKMSLERLYTAAVDELRPIEKYVKEVAGVNVDVERNPFIIAWLARGWTGKAETYLYHGVTDDSYKKVGPSLEEILKPLSKDLDDFRAYLVAKRAVELHGRNKRTGIDHDDAKEVIKELETSEFREAQKKLVEYQDALIDELIEAGVVSRAAAAAMRQLNQNYVPFYRVFDEQLGATYGFGKGGYGNVTNPVKKMKGSERDIIDPLESIIKNTFYMVNVAERNRVGEAIVKLAEGKEGAGKWVERLPTPMHGVKVSLDEIEGVLESVGIDTDAIDLDAVAHVFRPTYFPPGKENILTVFRNGKKMFYQLEPELYRATLALDKESSNLFINLMSLPAKTLRAGATLTPEFMARNPIRDIQEAMLFSNYGFNPADFAKGLFHALKQDDIFWKWKASGGAHGAMVSLDRDYLQGALKDLLARGAKDKTLNILKNPLEILQALSEFGEQATRLGEFAKGLKYEPQTRAGTMLASLSSRDVTLDFGRTGYSGKIPNRVIAFFNANVQGIDKPVREFSRNPNRTLMRCFLYITLPTILLYFFNRKDKRYQESPQWQKDVYWIIPTKKRLYRVPRPFTLGVIFGAFPERVLSYMDTHDPKAFDEFGESLRENALPDLIPTAFMGWIEAYSNKSFYTGRPIVPRSEETLEPEMQYTSYTSETAKLIGSVLEYSPRKIDHILKSYGGGMAIHGTKIVDGLIKIIDKKERVAKPEATTADYPLVGAFAPRMWASSDSIDKFYQKLDDMEREYKTVKKKGYTGPAKKELANYRSVARELSKLRVAAQDVHTHPTMTAKEKREALDVLSIIQINMARKTLGKELITGEEAGIN